VCVCASWIYCVRAMPLCFGVVCLVVALGADQALSLLVIVAFQFIGEVLRWLM
jgi:hypothetical protein